MHLRTIVCLEYFRCFMTRHKTVRSPSKIIEEGVFYVHFLVDLSRRKAVLLRRGPLWKGLGEIVTYTFTPLCIAFPLALWSILHFFLFVRKVVFLSVAVLRLAVVLLFVVVVPQAPAIVPHAFAVVPQVVTVVPLLGSHSTMSPGPAQHHKRK